MNAPSSFTHLPDSDVDWTELHAGLSQIVASAKLALGADRASFYALRPTGGTALRPTGGAVEMMITTEQNELRLEQLHAAIGGDVHDLPFCALLTGGEPLLIVEDAYTDSRVGERVARRLGIRAIIGSRLDHQAIVIDEHRSLYGILTCTFDEPRAFTRQERSTLDSLVLLASLALSSSHLQSVTQKNLRRVEALEAERAALLRVATAVATAGSDTEDVFTTAVAEFAQLSGSARVVLLRIDSGLAHVLGSTDTAGRASPGGTFRLAAGGVIDRCLRSAEATVVEDARDLPFSSRQRLQMLEDGIRSLIAIPITVNDAPWGAMIAGYRHPDEVSSASRALIGRFATLMSIAVVNHIRERQLIEQSTHDPLTRLPNHRAFFDGLTSAWERSRRRGHPVSLAMIDIDHFKRVNDRFGHPIGDAVLTDVADRFRSQARAEDTIGRIGGEEFAWLMPETTLGEALGAAERLREAIGETAFGEAGNVTVSIGVAELAPGMSVRRLHADADRALYRAKRTGRNRVVAASPIHDGANHD